MKHIYKKLLIYGSILLIYLLVFYIFIYTDSEIKHISKEKSLYSLLGDEEERIFTIQESLCPENPNYTSPQDIIPRPQNIEMIDCNLTVIVNSSWKIFIDLDNENSEQDNFTAYYLKNNTFEKTGINLEINDLSNLTSDKRIVIGNPNENPTLAQIASDNNISVNSIQQGFNQGYILLIKPEEILIFANNTTGSFYGAITLIWLLKQNNSLINLPNTKITDWPDFEIRGCFCSTPPNYSKEQWLENLTLQKFNMWAHGTNPVYNSTSSSSINDSLQMKKLSIERHFIPTVMLQPTTVRYFNPNFYEGIYAFNVSMKFNASDDAVSIENENFQLNNTGFEDDGNGDNFPDYWREYFSNYEGNWSWDCSESYSGSCSVKLNLSRTLNHTETESSSFLYTSNYSSTTLDYFDLEPNKLYLLSFWAKKIESENNGRNPQVTVSIKNPITGKTYAQSAIIEETDDWNKYYIKFSTDNGCTNMRIYSRAQMTNALQLWLDDFEITELTDLLLNVIKTPDTRLHVLDKNRTTEFVENIDYELIESGNINVNNPTEGKSTIIKRISNGSIPENAEIKVDYDFAVSLSTGQWVTFSDPYFFKAYEEIMVKPSMTNLNPEYVFINIDEIRGVNRDSRAQKRGLENYQLLAEFVNNVSRVIESYNKNIKIVTWDDMQNPFHNGDKENYQVPYGGPPGKMWYALDLLDRDLIQIIWWYSDKDYYKKMRMSPILFNKYGFEFLAGPGVYGDGVVKNNEWQSYLSYKYNALGYLGHSFHGLVEGTPINANYSWNAIKNYTEQCNPDYIEICDGIDNDCDDIYWTTSYNNETWPSNIDEGFNLTNDPFNCGTCGNICYYPKSYSSCINSTCQFDGCYEYYYDTNNNLADGCECKISNNGTEICDSIDNDCDGYTDEEVCPQDDNGRGYRRGSSSTSVNITNKTKTENKTTETNQTNQSTPDITTNQTEIPKKSKFLGLDKLIKDYPVHIIITLISIVIFFIFLKLAFGINKNFKYKRKTNITQRNQNKINRAKELILNGRKKGHLSYKIKKIFLEKGWPEDLIDSLIEEVNQKIKDSNRIFSN